jgi:hypothetical protein
MVYDQYAVPWTPQALQEAGLVVERCDEEGTRLVVRDAENGACSIRSRGGEALAELVASDLRVRALDVREANLTDNGVGQLCTRIRQTGQLEELLLGEVGHAGLSFLRGAIESCENLTSLSVRIRNLSTLHAGRQSQAPSDFDTSAYRKPEKKEGDPESEGEGEEEQGAGDDDDDPEEKARKKSEALKAAFQQGDFDSEDEEYIAQQRGGHRKKAQQEAHHEEQKSVKRPVITQAFRQQLEGFVQAIDLQPNLLSVSVEGDEIPTDLQLDLRRSVIRHREAKEQKLRAKQARGARTACDVLKDQLEELKGCLEQDQPQQGIAELVAGEDASSPHMRLGIRAFVGRRLFAALGEALFECQRFKAKGNEAVDSAEGEMAFVAMYLRRNAQKFDTVH